MDELCIVVKKAARVPSELLPLFIFNEDLWISLLVFGLFTGLFWSFLRCINNIMKCPTDLVERVEFYVDNYNFSRFQAKQSQMRQYVQIFIDSWLCFLSIPVRKFTRIQNERLFIASMCLTSLIFINLYVSGMSTVFVKPIYFKDINSLEQLDASGISINVKYYGYMTDVFPNDSKGVIQNLHNKMQLMEENIPSMDIVNKSKNVATITRKSTTQLSNSIYFIRKDLYLIENECPKNYYLAYMVPVHSPYLDRINEILFDIHRFGFIIKWINDLKFKTTLESMKSFHSEPKSKVLSMNDLRFPFIAFGVGSCLGTAFLLIECSFHLMHTTKKSCSKLRFRKFFLFK